MLDFNKLKT